MLGYAPPLMAVPDECNKWSEKLNGKYVVEQHGRTNECYATLEEAKSKCEASSDCGAVATQTNVCGGKFRVSHGGPTLRDWSSWEAYDLWAYALNRSKTCGNEVATGSTAQACVNTDSTQDEYGVGCEYNYKKFPSECGVWDDDDFTASDLCCICGGGRLQAPTPAPLPGPTPEPTPVAPFSAPLPEPTPEPTPVAPIPAPLPEPTPEPTPVATTTTAEATCGGDSCSVYADPHVSTFDAMGRGVPDYLAFTQTGPCSYRPVDVNAYETGDFWIVKAKDVKIQGRFVHSQEFVPDRAALGALVVAGPALRGGKLLLEPMNGHIAWAGQLLGEPASIDVNRTGGVLDLTSGPGPQPSSQRVEAKLPRGLRLVAVRFNKHVDVRITMPNAIGVRDGLCGNSNGVEDDDAEENVRARLGSLSVAPSELLFEASEHS